jgi:hypothetical protein
MQVTLDLQVMFRRSKGIHATVGAFIHYDLIPDGDRIEYVCENERDKRHLVGKSGEEFRVPAEVLAQYSGTYISSEHPPSVISLGGGAL